MEKIYLVKCRFDDTIEGFLERKEDFKEWLIYHNSRRDKNDIETSFDFDIIEVLKLNSEDKS